MKLATQKRNAGSRPQIESILKQLVDVKAKTITATIDGRRLEVVYCVAHGHGCTALAISAGSGSPKQIENGTVRSLSVRQSAALFQRLNSAAESGKPHKHSRRAFRQYMGWLAVHGEVRKPSRPEIITGLQRFIDGKSRFEHSIELPENTRMPLRRALFTAFPDLKAIAQGGAR